MTDGGMLALEAAIALDPGRALLSESESGGGGSRGDGDGDGLLLVALVVVMVRLKLWISSMTAGT